MLIARKTTLARGSMCQPVAVCPASCLWCLQQGQRKKNGKTAEENFSQTKGLTWARLEHYHPFGCPSYVLDAKLQGGVSKIPWWDPCSRIGIYLGRSPHQAGSVALVLNRPTGHVSLQYHVVYDDDFSTAENLRLGTIPKNWVELNKQQSKPATDENYQLAKEWQQETNSSQQSTNTVNWLTWLTEELNKPHFNTLPSK